MAEALTDQEERFCYEYLIDFNRVRAAVRAGYPDRQATSTAKKLMDDERVKAHINELIAEQNKRLEITSDRILQEYAKLAFSNVSDYLNRTKDGEITTDFSHTTYSQFAAISSVKMETELDAQDGTLMNVRKIEFKMGDKKGALDSLARTRGLFDKDSMNLNIPVVRIRDYTGSQSTQESDIDVNDL